MAENEKLNQTTQSTDPEKDRELAAYRKGIDEADREIIRLLLERANLAGKIGEEKRKEGTPIYRPDRERNVYNNIIKRSRELYADRSPPLPDDVLVNIYREVISGSIAVEQGPAIAYMGPPGSFSHLATRKRFGSSLREVPVDSIGQVFRTVESGNDATYGVVPVDNTTEGAVGPTLDMFLSSELKIYAEQYIRVSQNLLYFEEINPGDIKKLYTNKIAMEQSRNWLQNHLSMSKIEIVETVSTAEAARLAGTRKDGAAIASLQAAETYELKSIGDSIQDNPGNMTRFLVIGRDQCPPSGDDKVSIICSVNDSPGSLHRILSPFHNAGINLTRIESRATRRSYGDYNFFIDLLGHEKDPKLAEIFKTIAANSTFLKILGSYPRMEFP